MPKLNLTQEWLKWRMEGIGSSDAPAVMGASPWCTPLKLWQIKTGRAKPEPRNMAMQRGLDLEPFARQHYEQFTGIEMEPSLSKHSKYDFIRATFDGINEETKKVLEIKCPGREDHKKAIAGKIPEKYLWQCVHLLLVTGYECLDYVSFDGEKAVLVTFRRDRELEEKLLKAEIKFWECVKKDVPPSNSDGDIFRLRRNR